MNTPDLDKTIQDAWNVIGESLHTKFEQSVSLGTTAQSEQTTSIIFTGDNTDGAGLLWTGYGYTKQFIFNHGPQDKFFSSENLDLAKGKQLSINNIKILDSQELGSTITKSNLRQVGRLNGLIVDGSVNINQYLFYNATSDRLGLGTESPNAALSIVEDGVEVMIGAKDGVRGIIGTFVSQGIDIVTDNTARISVSSIGNILLGNPNTTPIQVTIHGTMGVNVNTIDNRAALHVGGGIKFNDKLHLSGIAAPNGGVFNIGDIVWNSQPEQRGCVGWVCTRSGTPGVWNQFGEIK